MKIYFDERDTWIGLYRDLDTGTRYVCLLPCLVIRWKKRGAAFTKPVCPDCGLPTAEGARPSWRHLCPVRVSDDPQRL